MFMRLALAGMFSAGLIGTAFAQVRVIIEDKPDIGYPSVAAAFEAAKDKPAVEISVKDGWTVIAQYGGLALWRFTQPGHPAHPALVKSEVIAWPGDGSPGYIRLRILCEAPKAACEKLKAAELAEFNQFNEQMRQDLNRGR